MQDAGGRRTHLIDGPRAARALLAPLFARARHERLVVAHLCGGDRLIGVRIRYAASIGTISLPVREIVADALALGTTALVLAHNHPSGDARPSETDIDATRSLVQAARPLGISVRDHLVFGREGVTSFRERGLL